MDFHFATAWELVSDEVGDSPALICGDVERSWREFEDRAARLAAAFEAHGLGAGTKVGHYLINCNEYLEGHFAAFKLGACPVNVNYRYQAEELVYLLDNADAEAVLFHATYAERIREIQQRLPGVKLWIEVADGAQCGTVEGALDYEALLAGHEPRPREHRAADEIYMLYTGGTTGMPKGVMYDVGGFCMLMAAMGLGVREIAPPEKVQDIAAAARALHAAGARSISLPGCPLMHGTGIWLGAFIPLLLGGTVVTRRTVNFDPQALLQETSERGVTELVIVGDAFARPLLAALDEAEAAGRPHDLSALQMILSSGVMWSTEIKRGLLRHVDAVLMDAMGSSEGSMGSSVASRELPPAETAKFAIGEGVKVFNDADEEVQPGSGEVGMVATSGFVPVGYYKDPEKSARTFREVSGVRYSFPGDFATVEADGSLTLLGRGSQCINTGGEKVFTEEVEEAAKRHPEIQDCLVVGLPDERFGNKVVAVVSHAGEAAPSDDDLRGFMRESLAGYKLPKDIVRVPVVQRAPNGKADYKWARAAAEEALGVTDGG